MADDNKNPARNDDLQSEPISDGANIKSEVALHEEAILEFWKKKK